MNQDEYLQLIADRNEKHTEYLRAKDERDQARSEATSSLSEHRAKLAESSEAHERARFAALEARTALAEARTEYQRAQTEIARMHAAAEQIKTESLTRHRAVTRRRDDAERKCERAWREYRETDKQVPEARLEMMGLTTS